ncbi:Uu.00g027900.m01.CDS01 [Anthostomella pinea]|uniref:Uu.00g027900.m01.CDS01 n=1 Tax=Anthostomella pinea TaxID=933095 RepID=A0AAI8YCR5_9PEZI|nr:Uu.00g027900.m01.CDS01 [Anthostomella pinea]
MPDRQAVGLIYRRRPELDAQIAAELAAEAAEGGVTANDMLTNRRIRRDLLRDYESSQVAAFFRQAECSEQ